MRKFSFMISTKEALKLVLKTADLYKPDSVRVNIENAIGQKLSENIIAKCNSPSFTQSAMDGYAFRLKDIRTNKPIKFANLENSAGIYNVKKIQPFTACRIFTGAKLPLNADVVIPQELVQLTNENLLIFDRNKIKYLDNIRLAGSQFKKGDVILKKGDKINAPRVALAASGGHAQLKIYKSPSVSILVTGNELIEPGKKISGDKTYESNSLMLKAILNELNIPVNQIFKSDDVKTDIVQKINLAFNNSNVLLISGGISVGKYDLVSGILKKLRFETIFYKVKQKPGKPLYFGIKGNRFIFGLPGNPAASLTCFYEYVIPFISKLNGNITPTHLTKKARLKNSYEKKKGLTHFLKGKIVNDSAFILPNQESYKLTSFAEANCLIIVPDHITKLKPGDEINYHEI
ncbi:MAG: molybdopterin molybdotransferase MoeA [Sphingobacteriaceae bacterium]|nr:molybdopterin molybdotransferase MoeA [Sphingobacteriaceae bacterium]